MGVKMTIPSTAQSERYSQLFAAYPLPGLMRNVQAHAEIFTIRGVTFPATRVDKIQPNCFTVSTHAALIDYGQEETAKLPRWQQCLLKPFLKAIDRYLHQVEIDKALFLNNYALSTNTLSDEFQQLPIEELTQTAVARYPEHTLVIRSLNSQHHADFMQRLKAKNWLFITSRQVYLHDDCQAALTKHVNSRRDQKLLNDGQFHFRIAISDSDFAIAEQCYSQLYIEKYSAQNVQFSAFGLKKMSAAGILKLFVLEESTSKEIVGTVGMTIENNGVVTVPIVGYLTDLPKKLGLYRRLMAFALRYCAEHNLRLNFSAGAPDFKKIRGARPEIEYIAVNVQHLPSKRAKAWQRLAAISPYYERLLKKYQL